MNKKWIDWSAISEHIETEGASTQRANGAKDIRKAEREGDRSWSFSSFSFSFVFWALPELYQQYKQNHITAFHSSFANTDRLWQPFENNSYPLRRFCRADFLRVPSWSGLESFDAAGFFSQKPLSRAGRWRFSHQPGEWISEIANCKKHFRSPSLQGVFLNVRSLSTWLGI